MRDRDFSSTCTELVVQQACGQMARGGLLCSAYKTTLTAQTQRTLQLVGRPEDALAVMSVTRVVLAVTSVTCVVCDDRPIWSLAVVNTPVLYLHCKYV